MKDSLVTFAFFAVGIILGLSDLSPELLHHSSLPSLLLALLVLMVGADLGANADLEHMARSFDIGMIALPLFTIFGTLLAVTLAAPLFGDTLQDTLAVGSGFGYYSLSSILIADLKGAGATELAAVALLANVVREMLALFCAPLFVKTCGRFAAVSAAGVCSIDVCLPQIIRTAGADMVPYAVFHGIALEISIPLLIAAFC